MEKVSNSGIFRVHTQSSNLVIGVFKADWCGDCKFIEPFWPEIEEKYGDRITFIEVDTEQVPDLVDELNILGIPSFVAFTDGRELVRYVNKARKSREEIEDFLNRALDVYRTLHDTAERKEE
ncbi:thioredoxin family protein [Paenibacillus shirakamiensis]|nr:thioredoxin family protein [Paenibacillus shirakamiensis]